MFNLTCTQCGKAYEKSSRDYKPKATQFCSKKCHGEWKSKAILVQCINCGKPFKKKLSQANLYNNHFCSRSCGVSFNNKFRKKK